MSHGQNLKTDVVIFFDENMPRMDKCSNKCQVSKLVLCKHRFNFNTEIFHTNKEHVGFTDWEILALCFSIIENSELFRDLSKRKRFILVTKDHNFLKDAEKALAESDNPKIGIVFDRKNELVIYGPYKIVIETIHHKNYGENGHGDLRRVIGKVNNRFSKQN